MLQNLIPYTKLFGAGFIARHGWLFYFLQINMIGWKYFLSSRYEFPKDTSAGLALTFCARFIGSDGGECVCLRARVHV